LLIQALAPPRVGRGPSLQRHRIPERLASSPPTIKRQHSFCTVRSVGKKSACVAFREDPAPPAEI
jgi:hypothetical protein